MADQVTVRIVGGKEVAQNIGRFEAKMTSGVKQAIKDGAYKIELEAKRIVPVRTGHLKSHISSEFQDEQGAAFSAKVGVQGIKNNDGVQADHYGKFVEFGTKRMAARPYLYPAYLANEQWIIDRVKRAVEPK